MNVQDLVTDFVTFRRSLGERCSQEVVLRAFCRAIGPRTSVRRIRTGAVVAFLGGTGATTRSWHDRYTVLKGFFQFAVSRGHLDAVPLPTELPKRPPRFVPYVYSREEIRRLLAAIPAAQHRRNLVEPHTLRAILLVLYGAGLRRGEALNLAAADVDLAQSLLTIRNTKFFKSRLVPVSADLTKALGEHARRRAATHPSADATRPFFLNRRGEAIHKNCLENAFKRLRAYAGVRRSDTERVQPRMHDLRHTFAVHRLTEWYRQGVDAQRLLYQLSVYLGHATLAGTQVYLTMTPELLQQASRHFERYARGEGGDA